MKDGSLARLFVAVDLPALVRERLAAWAKSAVSGAFAGRAAMPRLIVPESMHLTVCFLGNRPTSEIVPLGDAVGACGRAISELSLGAPLGCRRAARARSPSRCATRAARCWRSRGTC